MSRRTAGHSLVNEVLVQLRIQGADNDRFDNVVADRLGINHTDLTCVELVHRCGQLTAGQLATAAGLTSGGLTTVIDRLEAHGLLRRDRDPADRRRVVLRPTEQGRARVAPHFQGLVAASTEALAGYSDDELTLILDFLGKIRRVLVAEAEALRQTDPA